MNKRLEANSKSFVNVYIFATESSNSVDVTTIYGSVCGNFKLERKTTFQQLLKIENFL